MYQLFYYLGFLGTILVAVAYVPQIAHLVKEHCAVGISLNAWAMWLAAGFMMLPNAMISKSTVFTILLLVQIVLGAFILVFAYFHKGKGGVCPIHGHILL